MHFETDLFESLRHGFLLAVLMPGAGPLTRSLGSKVWWEATLNAGHLSIRMAWFSLSTFVRI